MNTRIGLGVILAASVAAVDAEAAVTTWLEGSTLYIQGSMDADAVSVDIDARLYVYELNLSSPVQCSDTWLNGLTTSIRSTAAVYDAGEIEEIVFTGRGGNDYFFNGADLPSQLYGQDGIDALIGGAADDVINGDTNNGSCNIIQGGGGDDVLAGGTFSTSCSGPQYISGDGGNDRISLGWGLGTNTAAYVESSGCQLVAHGGDGDDFIVGGTANDWIWGGDGADMVFSGSGNDNISGDDGNDTLDGGAGDDTIRGWAGDDTLDGGDGADTLSGEDGNDVVAGGDGDDVIKGDGGEDTLDGEDGADTVFGGADNDYIYGGDGEDALYGESGADHVYGEGDDDYLSGGSGRDDLFGGEGSNDKMGNWCTGGSGNDSMHDCNYSLSDW